MAETLTPELIWIIAGIVLIILEFVVPGLIVIFFGLGAFITGIALWIGLISSSTSALILFAVLSGGSLLGLRRTFKNWFVGKSMGVEITGDDEDFIGHMAEVSSGFDKAAPTSGRVNYRGADWDARSDAPLTLKPGAKVLITARQSGLLTVAEPT